MGNDQTNKLITIWITDQGVRARTLIDSLANQLIQGGETVIVLELGGETNTKFQDPSVWVPQLASLSPFMLRNYLGGPEFSRARISLAVWPPPPLLKQLCQILKNSYHWTFVMTSPDFTPEEVALLDDTDLIILMWESRSQAKQIGQYKSTLGANHFPESLLQLVSMGGELSTPDISPLVQIPDTPAYMPQYKNAISNLIHILQSRQDLYVPHSKEQYSGPNNSTIEDLKRKVQPQILKALESAPQKEANSDSCDVTTQPREVAQKAVESMLAQDTSLPASREAREAIFNQVMNEVLGLGAIEPLLKDPDVSEVMVNGKGAIFVEKKGKLHHTPVEFSSEAQLRTVIDRIVAPIGRRVDESMPLCDARLADGSRVNIVLPPLALDGAVLTIRKFMTKKLGLMDLVPLNSLTQEMADFLRACVLLRKNIVVSGGTGSGKTTLLNALSSQIPEDERIVTIEDAAELRLQKPHVVRLESRPPNAEGEGAIPIRRLVINALRMRPDRIVVGECRGGEALDMLQAMNTGHDGSLTTLHANTPRDALGRLETLVLMAGMDLPIRVIREQIRSAVHIIVQQTRLHDGSRKITSITEVTGMEGDTLTTQEIFRFKNQFEKTGVMPTFSQEMNRIPPLSSPAVVSGGSSDFSKSTLDSRLRPRE